MATLTSRPDPTPVPKQLSKDDLIELVSPAQKVLSALGSYLFFKDDSQFSIGIGFDAIEDILDSFTFFDYAVMSAPSLFANVLVYDVAVAPVQGMQYVSFKVMFSVQT